MARAIWIMMDSFGIGAAPDAEQFGDAGSDTLGHIAQFFKEEEGRSLDLPTLRSLGLGHTYQNAHGKFPVGWEDCPLIGSYANACEISSGKDTPSGHWELAGVPATWDWGYYPNAPNCFPQELLTDIFIQSSYTQSLGNCHSSGTEIIAKYGVEHMESGHPIFYTSADSVFQIAAHEERFGLENLYKLCEICRKILTPYNIGRVIARPFVGSGPENFQRTGNRKDYSMLPPHKTILDLVKQENREVIGLGKIGDIFAHSGLTKEVKAHGHPALWEVTEKYTAELSDGGLLFVNFVDFDSVWGHRRKPKGYGTALEQFDAKLASYIQSLRAEDLLVITADHGNDPTWPGSDHTREQVPILLYQAGQKEIKNYGERKTFADLALTLAAHLQLESVNPFPHLPEYAKLIK